jgi:hypothetical protein
MNRFFRCYSDEAYEQARLSLDAAWGHPTPDGRTVTCVDPASVGPRDNDGYILVAINAQRCEWPELSSLISALLASGVGQEITAQEYDSFMRLPPGYPQ